MKRRDVLKGALGTAALGSSVAVADEESPLSPKELDRELRHLRRDLDRLEKASDRGLEKMLGGTGDEMSQLHDRLVRSTMRTLTVAETLSALPAQNRQDPAVRQLVAEHANEMDYAMQGQLTTLASLDDQDLRELQQILREEPDLGLDIGEQLEGLAVEELLPGRRRRRLKKMVKHANWRLQRQPIDTVLEELLQGTDKLARGGTDEEFEALVRSHHKEAEWKAHRQALEDAYADALGTEHKRQATSGDKLIKRGRTLLTVGGILGGVALAMILTGAAFGEVGGAVLIVAGLFPATAFVVLMIIGLILLSVGSVRRRRERNRP